MTGGTGFIGSQLVKQLLNQGVTINCLTRDASKGSSSVHLFVGGVTSTSSVLFPFLESIDTFINCAGELDREELMYITHVDGTKNLLSHIEKSHAENQNNFHWIQLSSCGAYGSIHKSSNDLYINELSEEKPHGVYEKTKTEADQLIVDFSKQHHWFKYTIIRPTNVFGVGMRSTAIIRIAKMIKKRVFFFIGDRNCIANFVHIDDVMTAILLSVHQIKAYNQTYIVSNDCKFSDMVNTIADMLKVPKPFVVVNEFLLRKLVGVIGKLIKLPINDFQINVMTRRVNYDSNKIKKDLNWQSSSVLQQFNMYIKSINVKK